MENNMSGHLVPNSFSTYALTEADALQGAVLTSLQKMVLNNHLAILAEEKLKLEFDVAEPTSFIQQEAYKRGQIELMQYLLDTSDASQDAIDNPQDL